MRISDWSSDVCSSDLSRPAFSLTYTPGERTEGGENRGGAVIAAKGAPAVQPDRYWNPALGDVGPDTGIGAATAIADRSQFPGVTRSEEHTSELQSLMRISYAVFCLTKKTQH